MYMFRKETISAPAFTSSYGHASTADKTLLRTRGKCDTESR